MSGAGLLVDGFGRIREVVHEVLDGLDDADLQYRPDSQANSICWLIWHLTRVQDDHIAGVSDLGQVWFSGWEEQFGLPLDPGDIGYGHDSDQVGVVRASGEQLAGYHDQTCDQTIAFVAGLTGADLATSRGRALGSAGHHGCAAGQRAVRRPSARRPGRLPQGPDRATLAAHGAPRDAQIS